MLKLITTTLCWMPLLLCESPTSTKTKQRRLTTFTAKRRKKEDSWNEIVLERAKERGDTSFLPFEEFSTTKTRREPVSVNGDHRLMAEQPKIPSIPCATLIKRSIGPVPYPANQLTILDTYPRQRTRSGSDAHVRNPFWSSGHGVPSRTDYSNIEEIV